MHLLLDTHSFLWFAGGNDRISRKAREAIENTNNAAYLSAASLWEMAIKINIGKLELPKSLDVLVSEQMRDNEFAMLRSEVKHFETYTELPAPSPRPIRPYDHRAGAGRRPVGREQG
jgi:PIN domain nuclease of toxin-antitoxin system